MKPIHYLLIFAAVTLLHAPFSAAPLNPFVWIAWAIDGLIAVAIVGACHGIVHLGKQG